MLFIFERGFQEYAKFLNKSKAIFPHLSANKADTHTK